MPTTHITFPNAKLMDHTTKATTSSEASCPLSPAAGVTSTPTEIPTMPSLPTFPKSLPHPLPHQPTTTLPAPIGIVAGEGGGGGVAVADTAINDDDDDYHRPYVPQSHRMVATIGGGSSCHSAVGAAAVAAAIGRGGREVGGASFTTPRTPTIAPPCFAQLLEGVIAKGRAAFLACEAVKDRYNSTVTSTGGDTNATNLRGHDGGARRAHPSPPPHHSPIASGNAPVVFGLRSSMTGTAMNTNNALVADGSRAHHHQMPLMPQRSYYAVLSQRKRAGTHVEGGDVISIPIPSLLPTNATAGVAGVGSIPIPPLPHQFLVSSHEDALNSQILGASSGDDGVAVGGLVSTSSTTAAITPAQTPATTVGAVVSGTGLGITPPTSHGGVVVAAAAHHQPTASSSLRTPSTLMTTTAPRTPMRGARGTVAGDGGGGHASPRREGSINLGELATFVTALEYEQQQQRAMMQSSTQSTSIRDERSSGMINNGFHYHSRAASTFGDSCAQHQMMSSQMMLMMNSTATVGTTANFDTSTVVTPFRSLMAITDGGMGYGDDAAGGVGGGGMLGASVCTNNSVLVGGASDHRGLMVGGGATYSPRSYRLNLSTAPRRSPAASSNCTPQHTPLLDGGGGGVSGAVCPTLSARSQRQQHHSPSNSPRTFPSSVREQLEMLMGHAMPTTTTNTMNANNASASGAVVGGFDPTSSLLPPPLNPMRGSGPCVPAGGPVFSQRGGKGYFSQQQRHLTEEGSASNFSCSFGMSGSFVVGGPVPPQLHLIAGGDAASPRLQTASQRQPLGLVSSPALAAAASCRGRVNGSPIDGNTAIQHFFGQSLDTVASSPTGPNPPGSSNEAKRATTTKCKCQRHTSVLLSAASSASSPFGAIPAGLTTPLIAKLTEANVVWFNSLQEGGGGGGNSGDVRIPKDGGGNGVGIEAAVSSNGDIDGTASCSNSRGGVEEGAVSGGRPPVAPAAIGKKAISPALGIQQPTKKKKKLMKPSSIPPLLCYPGTTIPLYNPTAMASYLDECVAEYYVAVGNRGAGGGSSGSGRKQHHQRQLISPAGGSSAGLVRTKGGTCTPDGGSGVSLVPANGAPMVSEAVGSRTTNTSTTILGQTANHSLREASTGDVLLHSTTTTNNKNRDSPRGGGSVGVGRKHQLQRPSHIVLPPAMLRVQSTQHDHQRENQQQLPTRRSLDAFCLEQCEHLNTVIGFNTTAMGYLQGSGSNTNLGQEGNKTHINNSTTVVVGRTTSTNTTNNNNGTNSSEYPHLNFIPAYMGGLLPLECAARCRYYDLCEAMITFGADSTARNFYGVPIICAAASAGIDGSCVQLLLDRGADPNASDHKGRTALFYATTAAVIDVLIDGGADIFARDQKGMLPIHCCPNFATTKALIVEYRRECNYRVSKQLLDAQYQLPRLVVDASSPDGVGGGGGEKRSTVISSSPTRRRPKKPKRSTTAVNATLAKYLEDDVDDDDVTNDCVGGGANNADNDGEEDADNDEALPLMPFLAAAVDNDGVSVMDRNPFIEKALKAMAEDDMAAVTGGGGGATCGGGAHASNAAVGGCDDGDCDDDEDEGDTAHRSVMMAAQRRGCASTGVRGGAKRQMLVPDDCDHQQRQHDGSSPDDTHSTWRRGNKESSSCHNRRDRRTAAAVADGTTPMCQCVLM